MLLFVLVARGSEYVAWREGVLSQVEYVNVLRSDGRLVNIHKPVSSTSAGFGGYLDAGSR